MHENRRQTVHTQSVCLSVHAALCCRTSVCRVTTLCVSHWFQGAQGLGIMIIEGKHAEVGQGIFISDIQEGSAAEQVSCVSHGFTAWLHCMASSLPEPVMLQSRVEQDGKRVTKCNFVSLIGPYIQLLQVRANQQYKY